ncbi:Homeobox protein Hox-B6b [Oryzias melastigma]|uniref:Homeobox protein Hox-B6b n=2 Tax=Ovalentaria TaxID=1489908 RepID=A0A834FDK0_ORYME|nr:Homeobox protein Hox-B6b [Oryzias melastigma]
MSSYFVNSTFPVSLPGGQDSLLGQIPLYSSGYTDPLRHYSNAATYGAANMQEKVYPASYYQQTGAAAAAIYGRAGGGAPCDYNPVGTFYKDAEGSCAFSSREDQPLFVTQEHQQRKAECPEQAVSMSSSIDDKSSTLIYPWMQRMNACSADSVPPSCATASREPLELKSPSPPSDRSTTSGALSKATGAHFTEIEDASVAAESEEGAHGSGGSGSRAQQQQQPQQQHQEPNATSSTPTANDCQTPQIFPWMRKLHISHGIFPNLILYFCVCLGRMSRRGRVIHLSGVA